VIVLTFPYPLSANEYWQPVHVHPKKGSGKKGHISIVPTKEALAFKEEIGWRARAQGIRAPLAGPVEVTYQLYPRLPQDWAKRAKKDPVWWDLTVRCIDLDNARKVLNDAMKNIVFGDDSLIRKDPGEIMMPDGEARIVVTVKPYERAHPQDYLFAREPVYVPKPKRALDLDVPKERPIKIVPTRADGKPF
jgi:crossover junction endodeoxyribonuclease RusA